MDLQTLCTRLVPEAMQAQVLQAAETVDAAFLAECNAMVCDPENWKALGEKLDFSADDDAGGCKLYAVMLLMELTSYQKYREMGIAEEIFFDTMRFCPEYITLYHRDYGEWCFELRRAKWFFRQLALMEFRLGTLEFEMTVEDGEQRIYLHIPPKTDLRPETVEATCRAARGFFRRYFPDWADKPYYCDSWLLSPALAQVLPPESNVVRFSKLFALDALDLDSEAFVEWIFGRKDIPWAELPEDTALRRGMKRYILGGGKVGWPHGKLKYNW